MSLGNIIIMLKHCLKFAFGIAAGVAGIYYLKKLGDSEGQCSALLGKDLLSEDRKEKQGLAAEVGSCTSR